MNWFLIPLTASPQSFQITLNSVNYTMTVYWNPYINDGIGSWLFDLENADTSTELLAGAPFVTGADLLAGLEYLGIGGNLIVYTQGQPDEIPTYTNLGVNCNLYFVTEGTAS